MKESGDSMDDLDAFAEPESDHYEVFDSNSLSVGDYVVVKFSGSKRNATHYRYLCVVQNIFADENDLKLCPAVQ